MMKNKCLRCISYSLSVIFLSLSILLFTNVNFAKAVGDAAVTLESDKSAYAVGDSFTVWVKVNVTTSVLGAIEAKVNFDPGVLQYVSVLATDDFSETLEETTSLGAINVVRGKNGGLTGAATIYGINFKAQSAGNVVINLGTTSSVASDGSKMLLNLGTLNLTINNAVTVVPDNPVIGVADNTNTAATPNIGTTATTTETYSPVVISPSESTVTLDKATAIADGTDKICVKIILKDGGGKIIKTMKPVLKGVGGVDFSKMALIGDSWNACMTSASVSEKKVTVLASGIVLSEQIVKFALSNAVTKAITPENIPGKTKISDILPADVLESELINIMAKIILPNASSNIITSKDLITITGTATPNTRLLITIHSAEKVEEQTSVDSSGKWSVKLDKSLAPGSHRVEVAVLDSYGNQSSSKVVAKFDVEKAKSSWLAVGIKYGIVCLLLLFLVFILIKRHKKNSNPSLV